MTIIVGNTVPNRKGKNGIQDVSREDQLNTCIEKQHTLQVGHLLFRRRFLQCLLFW